MKLKQTFKEIEEQKQFFLHQGKARTRIRVINSDLDRSGSATLIKPVVPGVEGEGSLFLYL